MKGRDQGSSSPSSHQISNHCTVTDTALELPLPTVRIQIYTSLKQQKWVLRNKRNAEKQVKKSFPTYCTEKEWQATTVWLKNVKSPGLFAKGASGPPDKLKDTSVTCSLLSHLQTDNSVMISIRIQPCLKVQKGSKAKSTACRRNRYGNEIPRSQVLHA